LGRFVLPAEKSTSVLALKQGTLRSDLSEACRNACLGQSLRPTSIEMREGLIPCSDDRCALPPFEGAD
jgi:hypothetical protein